MRMIKPSFILASIFYSISSYAENSVGSNSSADFAKVIWGLFVVIAIIIALAWLLKRMTHIQTGGLSVAHIVGAVSVGTRERVVVLEIANRWIVVGVAPGQITAIANLDKETNTVLPQDLPVKATHSGFMDVLLKLKNARSTLGK